MPLQLQWLSLVSLVVIWNLKALTCYLVGAQVVAANGSHYDVGREGDQAEDHLLQNFDRQGGGEELDHRFGRNQLHWLLLNAMELEGQVDGRELLNEPAKEYEKTLRAKSTL